MNKVKYFLMMIIAITGVFSVSATASPLNLNSDAKAMQTLERKILKRIVSMPYYGVFDHIAFKLDGKTVTLYGKVNNAINKKAAENYVKDLDGIENVINNIEILPPSRFDDAIRHQILRSFYQGGSLYRYLIEPRPSVRIVVEHGRVTLEGIVSSGGDSDLANILANGVSGVFNVRNNLRVAKEISY